MGFQKTGVFFFFNKFTAAACGVDGTDRLSSWANWSSKEGGER